MWNNQNTEWEYHYEKKRNIKFSKNITIYEKIGIDGKGWNKLRKDEESTKKSYVPDIAYHKYFKQFSSPLNEMEEYSLIVYKMA